MNIEDKKEWLDEHGALRLIHYKDGTTGKWSPRFAPDGYSAYSTYSAAPTESLYKLVKDSLFIRCGS